MSALSSRTTRASAKVTIVGIDPGTNGGIAALFEDGAVGVIKMPEDVAGVVRELTALRNAANVQVFIEKIPKFCGVAQYAKKNVNGSAMAVLYGNFRLCVGVCAGMGIPCTEVAPIKWMNLVECRNTQRLERGPWKNKLKARAQELFPKIKVTLWNADALLIAQAGKLLGG